MNLGVIFTVVPLIILITAGYALIKHRLQSWFIYTINKGSHYCHLTWNHLIFTTNTYLTFSVIFNSGYDYVLTNTVDQFDINKLYGLGYGLRGPSYNSYRIGWRWNDKSKNIELFVFVQEQRSMWFDFLTNILPGEQVTVRMIIESGVLITYLYQEGKETIITRYKFRSKIGWLKYRCLPFFGGNQVSPNDVKILIKETR